MNPLERDFFTDPELMRDPTPYYRAQHERGPIFQERFKDVFMVSGLEEVLGRYLGGSESGLARWLLSRRDEEVLISIEPERLFSWDYRERMSDT